jgi:hypothetical protein
LNNRQNDTNWLVSPWDQTNMFLSAPSELPSLMVDSL